MFTLRAVEDDYIVLASRDSGDIARVFRLLGYDLPIPSGRRVPEVHVTIFKEELTENVCNDTSQEHGKRELQPELPF